VQRIVDAMGGKIRVSSTLGHGTAFTALFPVIKA
jgi:signal transduction histidine kinase